MGYLIDTSIFVAWERASFDRDAVAQRIGEQEVALSVITASELLHGVHRADGARRRGRREQFVEQILEALPVLPIDLEVSRVHARIWVDLRAAGTPIGAHDLWIAATALSHGLSIATHNVREFARIPDLAVETW